MKSAAARVQKIKHPAKPLVKPGDVQKQLEASWNALHAKFEQRGKAFANRERSKVQAEITKAIQNGEITRDSMKDLMVQMRANSADLKKRTERKMFKFPFPPWPHTTAFELDIASVQTPPYASAVTDPGYTWGPPDQWVQVADQNQGFLNLAEHCVTNSSGGWGATAGVGIHYVAQTEEPILVSFRPLIRWNYDWALDSAYLSASTYGEIGVQAYSFEGDISTLRDEGQNSVMLFSQDTNETSSGSDSSSGLNGLQLDVPWDPARTYTTLAYIFARTNASGNSGLFAGSEATTDLLATVVYFMVQEFGYL